MTWPLRSRLTGWPVSAGFDGNVSSTRNGGGSPGFGIGNSL